METIFSGEDIQQVERQESVIRITENQEGIEIKVEEVEKVIKCLKNEKAAGKKALWHLLTQR